jgi:plasmid stabilization system protein ParE
MHILLTPRATQNLDSIIDHIKQNWGESTAKQFIQKTDNTLTLLKSYPLIGQIEKDDIRGFQLSPQTRIFYRISEEKIIILAFFDVRQDPNKKLG